MDGILILGDVRQHSLFFNEEPAQNLTAAEAEEKPSTLGRDSTPQLDAWIDGGAYMVADLTHLALFDLQPGVNKSPTFLTYPPPSKIGERTICWDYSWTLKPVESRDETIKRRCVLLDAQKRYDTRPNDWAPLNALNRTNALLRRKLFDSSELLVKLGVNGKPTASSKVSYDSIDLLIIDDLDKCFRRWTASEPLYRNLISSVFAAFRNKLHDDTAPRLQPMILVCLKELPPTEDMSNRRDNCEQTTYWRTIIADPDLRDRTLVILDAENLREAGLDISESLSWEQTAQDVLDELQKKPRLQDFRKVGHVIVLFGAQGVLHVRREGNEWTSRLFFFPETEDRWQNRPDDGTVLGYGAIMLASLSRSFWRCCVKAEKGGPFVSSLSEALEDGIMQGLLACNYFCRRGYGEDTVDCSRRFARTSLTAINKQSDKWYVGIPRDM